MRESDVTEEITIDFKAQDSFAVYSMPGSSDYRLIYQSNKKSSNYRIKGCPSFIIAPFAMNLAEAQYINAEHSLTNVNFKYSIAEEGKAQSTSRGKYLNDLDQIIEDINADTYQKLVYSRVIKVDTDSLSIGNLFSRLVKLNKKAFVFCYHTPASGCWIGASPELLVEDNLDHYKTLALAGTQLDLGLELKQVEWGRKEREEQKFLRDFISNRLHSNEIRYQEKETRTVKAGNVLHIATEFEIERRDDILSVAQILHPGPAICGTPQNVAYANIIQYESHERNSYCGYLGPLGIEGESALFVNLRSMRIYRNQVLLYVGGGITIDSNPQAEWEETENKSQTLLNVIQKSYNC